MCDFDGSQCTLMQVQAEDQADWSIVKALETSESTITVDHTTDTGDITKTKTALLPWSNFVSIAH